MRIKASGIAGKGVFATRRLRKGQLIATMKGRRHRKRYRNPFDLRVGPTWVCIGHDLWIEPFFPIRFMNHCCEPNAGFKSPSKLYAMRDIAEGEEISIDYSAIEYVRFWSMPCTCGVQRCRSKVRSIQYLDDTIYKSYLPFVPPFFQLVRKRLRIGDRGNHL